MRRREFISCGTAAAVWPLGALARQRREFFFVLSSAVVAGSRGVWAQQAKIPKIGILVLSNLNPELFLATLREALRERGYVEGHNVFLEIRSGGSESSLADQAAELARLKVDVIVGWTTPPAKAAKQATNEIPIVMVAAGDPVGAGLVGSIAKPGGNVTGVSSAAAEVAGKGLQIIREILPSAHRVAVLANPADPFSKPFVRQISIGAGTLGIELQTTMVRSVADLDPAFMEMSAKAVEAIIVQPSLLQKRIIDLALHQRLATISITRQLPEAGGLVSYAGNSIQMYRESAIYIDKILKGSKPADLPVQEPTRFELIINLKTAKLLGITVPSTLLARADEVIE